MDLLDKYKAVLDALRALPPMRERALAITKLEESALWASCCSRLISSPIDWVAGAEPKGPGG